MSDESEKMPPCPRIVNELTGEQDDETTLSYYEAIICAAGPFGLWRAMKYEEYGQ